MAGNRGRYGKTEEREFQSQRAGTGRNFRNPAGTGERDRKPFEKRENSAAKDRKGTREWPRRADAERTVSERTVSERIIPERRMTRDIPERETDRRNPDSEMENGILEGRNVILEAYRSGRTIDRLLIQDGCQDGPIQSIKREARRQDTIIDYVSKERLDHISQTGKHQGVIAYAAAYTYASVEDILAAARAKGEDPFVFLLDDIEDPHNLGAIIRTANLAGAHGVIIPKRHAAGLTATVARASAGAINYTPVARVTNLGQTMEELKKEGLWFACADMAGEVMYTLNLTGPLGIVIGNEGDGVGRLLKEKCDYIARIPTRGDIDSLNASVAAGVLAFEVVRQRRGFR